MLSIKQPSTHMGKLIIFAETFQSIFAEIFLLTETFQECLTVVLKLTVTVFISLLFSDILTKLT